MPASFVFTLLLCIAPAFLALAITPFAARLLAGIVKPQTWMVVAAGWAIVSTIGFALWMRNGVNAEVAANAVGPFRQNAMFMVLGFVFWNGVVMLATNAMACVVGIVGRKRRQGGAG